tara:strand:+ start:5004 stop:5246 length:243 start_codon:yes stop_codon:yes gene_type:complete
LDAVSFDDMDLIVTGMDMPMPGDEVISRLRESRIHIPTLVTVTTIMKNMRRQLLTLGAQEILQKPIDLTVLFNAATRYLG